ncbi:hypothetical protein [Heyndrickxia ginsengihumi]|uniref:Uncharacterized protein n=1 Tax=Heyndrickxia ginsengihumi TaxID=363870 RepID=A0A0A6V9K7_9BACI|nr:hypothetical protein [Heyndrickxia ginsengihumi]KHD84243.1 hypothetical protein NG54_16785 [Heyndrickxia ginsengihumi]MBE6184569.1 hypothetical protein [Bacillus sp. (in: firmicutes)]MCM3022123.1 hypothetical protein [Heyndrickxia ginsengihumi]NEY18355.1 hypothetical protein [Heyndrickxia ginsengihumi]
MKNHAGNRGLIYVHTNEVNHYVLSYGIEFREFYHAFPKLTNLLLLRHQFDSGMFNLHTLFEYVDEETVDRLVEDDVYRYGDFCWIDFEDEEGLDLLEGYEIAELLYLSHIKHHLRMPFYRKLNNRFVYLAQDDGWFNKTYYRSMDDFYKMLGDVISLRINEIKGDKSLLFARRKKKNLPPVPVEVLTPFITSMKEGMLISLDNSLQTRAQIEIPVWIIGDFHDMDEMYEEYLSIVDRPVDGKLIFDHRSREWKVLIK